MSDRITFGVEGWQELERKLKALPAAVAGGVLEAAARAGAAPMFAAAQQRVPRRKGTLAKDLRLKVMAADREHATVGIGFFSRTKAHLVEFGHQQVKGGRLGSEGAHVVGHVPAHPFLRPAFDETQEMDVRAVGDVLRRALESEVRK
jgi:HK97 gp10 family phage protein